MKKIILHRVPCAIPVRQITPGENAKDNTESIEWLDARDNLIIPAMAVIQEDDGALWKEGTGFLISRLIDRHFNKTKAKLRTVERKADDLALYKRILGELQIDIRADERFKALRPTYAFLAELQNRIAAGQMAESSGQRIIGTVVEYHRWDDYHNGVVRAYPLWVSYKRKRHTTDYKGVDVVVHYETTDLHDAINKMQQRASGDYIRDGGKLKPLTPEQQSVAIKALYDIGNTEMYYCFLVTLTSSARMQTALTLRKKHFLRDVSEKQEFVRIHTGPRTGIDTKRNKHHYLDIPVWLYKKIKAYVMTERYQSRAPQHSNQDENHYVFYTTHGHPYYTSNQDHHLKYSDGSAVRVFIAERLLPEIARAGHSFRFRFHDLRATYCSNRLDEGLQMIEKGQATLDGVLRGVQDAMGHSDIRITQRYLDYKGLNPVVNAVNKEWNEKLVSVMVQNVEDSNDID